MNKVITFIAILVLITGCNYRTRKQKVRDARDNQIERLKTALNAGQITQAEYLQMTLQAEQAAAQTEAIIQADINSN